MGEDQDFTQLSIQSVDVIHGGSPGRKHASGLKAPLPVPDRPTACWLLDFVHGEMTDGREDRMPALPHITVRQRISCEGQLTCTMVQKKKWQLIDQWSELIGWAKRIALMNVQINKKH